MELYLLRHGHAERDSSTGRDADRRLSIEGAVELRRSLERARVSGARPSVILSSPYARAIETASIAAVELQCAEAVIPASSLTPDSTPRAVWDEVRLYADRPALLLVSHEPLISAAAAWMLGPMQSLAGFHPAGIVCIDFVTIGPEPRGVIRWDFRASH